MKALAKRLLADPNLRILDTETTGLTGQDEIVQIAVLDGRGNVLLDSLVNPLRVKVSPKAYKIHGIGMDDLKDAPTIQDLEAILTKVLHGRSIVAYNASFDRRLLQQSLRAGGLRETAVLGRATWTDVMVPYAKLWGDWDSYRRSYRWQPLTAACRQQGVDVNDAHNALGDAQLTLALLRKVAGVK